MLQYEVSYMDDDNGIIHQTTIEANDLASVTAKVLDQLTSVESLAAATQLSIELSVK